MEAQNPTSVASRCPSDVAGLLLIIFGVLPAILLWSDGVLAAWRDPHGFVEVLCLVVKLVISE